MIKGIWTRRKIRTVEYALIGVLALGVLIVAAGLVMLRINPSVGAYGVEYIRKVVGNQPVVVMETALFHAEDTLKHVEYSLGLLKQENPFGATTSAAPMKGVPTKGSIPATGSQANDAPAKSEPNISVSAKFAASQNSSAAPIASDAAASPATPWMPAAVDVTGEQSGYGTWQPFFQDANGQVVAYRTFIQPDLTRPYAYTAIVAFDLNAVRLHYAIGTSDPYAPGVKKSASGAIPANDLQPGLLLAAFNGGFKYEHGHFGSMAGSLISAPPLNGMGTLVIDQNGNLKMGEWGTDFTSTEGMLAFRQNGPLVIQNGKISPRVDNSLMWGETITGGTVTMRSGIALSADGRTLYYFAGPSLNITTLAKAMLQAHVQTAMQLDINDYWVHFTSFTNNGGSLEAVPLLPKEMVGDPGRFLRPYIRDFFYLTVGQ